MRVLGAVLAGGQARRFGSDKALALLDGRALIEHAAAAIAPYVEAVVVCGRAGVAGLSGVPDHPAPDLGPLGGLCGALHHARAAGFEAVMSIGCDMPVLPVALAERLLVAGACFVWQSPIVGKWPVGFFEALERHLALQTDRSIRRWAADMGAAIIEADDGLPNFNHEADLLAYRKCGAG